jgi:hypothetical protein
MAETRARLLATGFVCTFLSFGAGCASMCHPMQPAGPDVAARCLSLQPAQHDRVHIFVINGLDPFHITNATGFAQYLRDLGFHDVQFSMMWTSGKFAERIRALKAAEPSARVVIIGYSMGVCFARKLAQRVQEQGITVDLLLFLDAYTFNNYPEHSPADGTRIVNMMTEPRGFLGSTPLAGIPNYEFIGVRHYFVPTTQCIVERVVREITDLAEQP